jgi:hypothetical protein
MVDMAPHGVHAFQTPAHAKTELRLDAFRNLFKEESAQEIGGQLEEEIQVEHEQMMALFGDREKTGKLG